MRIAIDARAYGWAGIGRCIRNLLTVLANSPRSKNHHFIILAGRENSREIERDFPFKNFSVKTVESSYYSLREQTVFLQQINAINADIWHFMHFNVPVFFNRPYVVTIHDTTRLVFPGQKRQNLWQQAAYEYVFQKAVEKASAVACASKTTEKELLKLPLRLPNNVKTILWGLEDKFLQPVSAVDRQKVRMLLGTNGRYLLFVGVWMNHKNLPRLVEAFKILTARYPDLKLVLTGKPKPGYNNMVVRARELQLLHKIVFPGFVSDKLLPALYAEAACLVFPSLYEGFGFPALEAVSLGTPVVTSNLSCMPEVMGDVAEYVNPEYVPGIAKGIDNVLKNDTIGNQIKRAGPAWARKFDWKKVAEEYLDMYEEAVLLVRK